MPFQSGHIGDDEPGGYYPRAKTYTLKEVMKVLRRHKGNILNKTTLSIIQTELL